MKTKTTILLIFLLPLLAAKAQLGDRQLDVRLGLGGIGFEKIDYVSLIGELELASELDNHFSLASSVVSSWQQVKSDNSHYDNDPTLLQLNLNAFVSPFGNDRRNNFRIGAGPSYYHFFSGNSGYNGHNALGFSLVTENAYTIRGNTFLALKVFRQQYFNKHVLWGLLLKIGVKI